MLLGLASIILSLVFSFRAYNNITDKQSNAAKNIRLAGILIASALALIVIGFAIAWIWMGIAMWKSFTALKTFIWSSAFFVIWMMIIAGLLIAGLVYAWIAYTDSINTNVQMDILIAAIAISVTIITPLFTTDLLSKPMNINFTNEGTIKPEIKNTNIKTFPLDLEDNSVVPIRRTSMETKK
jgi:hypothetical protein